VKACARCKREKGKSFFRVSDWKSKYGVCRECRRKDIPERRGDQSYWRTSMHGFFGESVRANSISQHKLKKLKEALR
jgi:hypothetical protein